MGRLTAIGPAGELMSLLAVTMMPSAGLSSEWSRSAANHAPPVSLAIPGRHRVDPGVAPIGEETGLLVADVALAVGEHPVAGDGDLADEALRLRHGSGLDEPGGWRRDEAAAPCGVPTRRGSDRTRRRGRACSGSASRTPRSFSRMVISASGCLLPPDGLVPDVEIVELVAASAAPVSAVLDKEVRPCP